MEQVRKLLLDKDYTGRIVLLNFDGREYSTCNVGTNNFKTIDYIEDKGIVQISNMDFSNQNVNIYISANGFTIEYV